MNKIFLFISLLFLFSFALLSKYEDRGLIRNIDLAVTVKVQEKIDNSKRLRTVNVIDTILGGSEFFASPQITVIVTLLATGLMWKKKRLMALVIPLALVLLVGAEVLGKSLVHHPGPPFQYIKHTTGLFPDNYINAQYSYPSGHAARAVFIAFLVCLFVKNRRIASVGLAIYVGLVALSKIYLGHHWFSDIVGGVLLGGSSIILFAVYFSNKTIPLSRKKF